ncbi:MAG: hypothetical protein AAGF20_00190 [Pseudomonadota bacterium]
MTTTGFTCRECGQSWDDYDAVRKRLDPRVKRSRIICGGCVSKIKVAQSGGPYAGEVGSKGGGQSRQKAIEWGRGRAGILRQRVYEYVKAHGPHGADEIAEAIGEHWHDVRPRASELTTAEYNHALRVGDRKVRSARGNPQSVYEINEVAA